MTLQQILLKYWGYSAFRPLQEDIVNSVLDGRDTLALLPTGGGKSICYQVPALAREGLCLVISPLIALMKDQVDNLKKRGIPAAAIYSGMQSGEVEKVLGNCRFGNTKLLYVSPERLTTLRFREAVRQLKINLLAVDEAHCVSQWGYDFRPPYLQIADFRELTGNIPVLALTATATPKVVTDIQQKLGFRTPNVFRKSFERKNLTYMVIHEEDKLNRLVKIINKVSGPGIVYVRNRRQTQEIAQFLQKNRISADFYHAGLDPKTRDKRQSAWMSEDKRVMVSTNAFGMGIDKPNVRFVVHLDLPDSIEAYFQEAGRGGRDEKQAYAVLLYENADILDARHNLLLSFPEIRMIRDVYQAIGNYFQVPAGMGKDLSFDFDLGAFSDQYNFQPVIVFNCLRFLEKEGYLMLSEGLMHPSRLHIKAQREELYRFQVENEAYDHFLKVLLRSYGGILSDFVPVSETEIARRSGLDRATVSTNLAQLVKMKIIDYIPRIDKPQIIFLQERLDAKNLVISPEHYRDRHKDAEKRMEAMIRYVQTSNKCRSRLLLSYFGECNARRCGKCDVCIERNKISLNEFEFDHILNRIKPLLKSKACSLKEILESTDPVSEEKVIRALRWLIDNEKVVLGEEDLYTWKRK